MGHVLSWVALEELLACAWFVIAWPVFAGWPDRGFGVAKAGGLLMLAATSWTLAWVAGLPLTASTCWLLAALMVAVSALCLVRRRREISDFLSVRFRECAVAEALWIGATAVFLLLRAWRPQIAGAEKFMDFAFLNAALRSPSLPIEDPWFAGASINYYHFGFTSWASIARMLGTPAPIAYNLATGIIPGLVGAAAYSIALVLTRSKRLGLLSAVLLVVLGNLAGARELTSLGSAFDVWSPTRVIPGTINEFPFFTFFWADLHPHLMAMPNFLVFVALALVVFEERAELDTWVLAGVFAWLGVSAGVAAATSPWDVLPLGVIVLAFLFTRPFADRLRMELALLLSAAVAAAIAAPPFLSASASGVRVGFATNHSPFGAFLLVQGIWLLPSVLVFVVGMKSLLRFRGRMAAMLAVSLVAGITTRSVTVGVLSLLTCISWEALVRNRYAALLAVAPAMSVLLLAELVYVDDAYGRALERMNIVFKMHLDAILLMGVALGTCGRAAWERAPSDRTRWSIGAALVAAILVGLVYPVGAALSSDRRASEATLDGTAYLQREQPGDAAAIRYLNREVRDRAVVVEATGDAYSYAARISSNTGLPTILGWANHERLWRRSPGAQNEIAGRLAAVQTLYEGDIARAREVVKRYGVRYVIVGDFERSRYPTGDFAKFDTFGRKVFEEGRTAVFEMSGSVNTR